MKAKGYSIALATSLALLLSGCGGGGAGASASKNGTADGKTVLEFWSNHPGNSKPLEEELIKRFEAKHPDLKVKLIDAGKDYEEVAQKFNAALSGSQVPDVVITSDVTWYNFALNKQLAPLDQLLEKVQANPKDYVASLYDEYVLKDQHFAVPYSRSTPLFYYNKTLWQEAGLPDRGPKTWDEWNTEFAPKLKAKFPNLTPMALPDGASYLEWVFQGMIWSFGGAYSKDLQATFSAPESIQAGEYLQKQIKDGNVKLVKDVTVPFVSGQAAAMLESTGSLNGVAKDGKVDFATAFLPTPDGVIGCSTGGAGLAIPAKSKNQEAAARFISFVTNPENTVYFSQNTGYMPVRTSAQELPEEQEYLAAHPNFKTALEQLPFTKKQDAARVYVQGGSTRIGAALDRIAQGESVKKVFAELDQETQKIIDRDILPKLKEK